MESLRSYLGVTERLDDARLEGRLTIVGASPDALRTSMTVDEHDFMGESTRTIGFELEMERGSGSMELVPLSDVGANLILTRAPEGSELTFRRIRGGQSTLLSGELRAPRRVRLTILRGTLGGERRWRVFEGYLRAAGTTSYPASADLVAHDGGSVLAKPLVYVLAEQSRRARQDVWTEICQRHRIPPGAFGAADGGGRIVKGINESGGRTIAAFFAEFFAPIGYRVEWTGVALNVVRYEVTDPPVRTLTWSDMHDGDIAVAAPDFDVPNVVRCSGTIFPYAGPDLTGVQVSTVDTLGPYLPAAAIEKQDHLTGVITSVAPVVSAEPLLSRVVTTTTMDVGTITAQSIVRWGWAAPAACNKRQTAAGAISYNNQFTVYRYADGTWRNQDRETWQIVEQTIITRVFSGGFLSQVRTALWQLGSYETYAATIVAGGHGELVYRDCLMTDAGNAWVDGAASVRPLEELNVVEQTAGGIIGAQVTGRTMVNLATFLNEAFPAIGGPPAVGPLYGGPTVYVFGPTAARRYAHRSVGSITVWHASQILTSTGPESHAVATAAAVVNYVAPIPYRAPPVSGVVQVATPQPLREQFTRTQAAQPASVTHRDEVRIALVGQAIQANVESGWCESLAELNTVARDHLQELGASDVPVVTDVDPALGPGRVIVLPAHPELAGVPEPVLIMSDVITLDTQTYECAHELRCRYLPMELR